MTSLVNGLVAEGLVKRQLNPADARSVVVMATETGRRAFAGARRPRLGLLTTRLAELTDDDLDVLSRAAGLTRRVVRPTTHRGDPG